MATKKIELEMALRGEGCLGKAADDEPVFILRAQDALAPMIVETWAENVIRRNGSTKKTDEALTCVTRMVEWQLKNGCKVPD